MRFAALLGVVLLIGCADPKRDAREVAQKFSTAMETHDRAQGDAQLTRAARERGTAAVLMKNSHQEVPDSISVGEATVEGDNARVAITTRENGPATLLLRKEEGLWRVWGLEAPSTDGSIGPVTVNFEKPEALIGDVARAAGEALGSAIKGFADGLQKGLSSSPSPKAP